MTRLTIEGYLTEPKLARALKKIVGDRWQHAQITVAGTRRRWDMGFMHHGSLVLVEYDGDEHYRQSLKIKVDREKDAMAEKIGYRTVRFPYWVQLDARTLKHYFHLRADIRQDFAHGFITTRHFPASFCELGVARFRCEMNSLPKPVQRAVVRSLRERAEEHGIEYVVPSSLRDLLNA